MTFAVPNLPQRIVGGTVNRNGKEFTKRERACVAALRSYITQAYRNAERFEQMQRAPEGRANGHGPARAELTKREAEVLHWAGCGKTNEEIAIIIGAAAGTVKKHLEHIYDKLGVSNRTAAVMRAGGLLPGPPAAQALRE
jgi:DNA-binding NarL/FixJ family response regulator